MMKRVIAAGGVLLAFFAVSALPASASTLYAGSTVVPVGTKIASTANLAQFFMGGGSLVCPSSSASGEVNYNTPGGESAGIRLNSLTFGGSGAEGSCTYDGGESIKVSMVYTPVCMNLFYGITLSGELAACGGSPSIRLKLERTGVTSTCEYARSFMGLEVKQGESGGTLTAYWNKGELPLVAGNAFCAGTIRPVISYPLKTAAGGTLTLKQK